MDRRSHMDHFLMLTTTTSRNKADRLCDRLEDAGIPVILEHIEVRDGALRAIGYRLLVPARNTAVALKLLGSLVPNHYVFDAPTISM